MDGQNILFLIFLENNSKSCCFFFLKYLLLSMWDCSVLELSAMDPNDCKQKLSSLVYFLPQE